MKPVSNETLGQMIRSILKECPEFQVYYFDKRYCEVTPVYSFDLSKEHMQKLYRALERISILQRQHIKYTDEILKDNE